MTPAIKCTIFSILIILITSCEANDPQREFLPGEWPVYQGDNNSSQYSPLTEINTGNVNQLEVAWIFNTGDVGDRDRSEIQCNPLMIDGTLYGTTPRLKLFALDAATGQEKWRFDPFSDKRIYLQTRNRGVAYWASGDRKRIFLTAGNRLFSVDAETGLSDKNFGDGNGYIFLTEGLGRDLRSLDVSATTPGIIYKNLFILGSRVAETAGAAPGHIRAFDVLSGEQKWIFHTIPQPGEFGHDTWPKDAWQTTGGANSWSGISLDAERGIVYVPTGSPAFDFYGGDRPGDNLFGNCLIALNAATGERIWHYQFVRHDIWDRDLPARPNLLTLTIDGKTIDAVAQITKSGHVFIFNRETGEPLFPIEEVPAAPSDLRGEWTAATQPLPLKPPPFARQILTEDNVTNISPESRALVLEQLRLVRSGGQFVPPSVEGTVIYPGFDGGGEWGGAAHDPNNGIMYVNSNEMAWILTMVDLNAEYEGTVPSIGRNTYMAFCAGCHGANRSGDGKNVNPSLIGIDKRMNKADVLSLLETGKGAMPAFNVISDEHKRALVDFLFSDPLPARESAISEQVMEISYSHTGYNRFYDPEGYPAVKPPWGTLNAIDLNKGEIKWQVPLGEFPELTARGIPPTGTENYGGPIVTAGGVVFIGASQDEKFRAFDAETGEILWETQLPAGGYATPCTYEVNGRQFVVIACGGGKMGTKSADAYVAFSLPR